MGEQTLYSLKKNFEAGISLFYSASVGSIKRALDVLLNQNLVRVANEDGGPRRKKTYAITDAGRAEFQQWMRSPLTASDAETTALARTFFLGLVKPADQTAALAAIIARMEEDLQRLSTFAQHLDALEVPPEVQPIFIHQRATLDYGIGAHEFALAWFRRHAATVERSGGG
jgi:DNA-binding PadR family transcriptional regulator